METPQPDKTGMHILLKLASLVVISRAFTQRQISLCSCYWRCFLPSSCNLLLILFIVGEYNAQLPHDCSGGYADCTNRAGRRTGGIV
ncbi:hypothetical protein ACLK2A_18820 [Escherichia coli]